MAMPAKATWPKARQVPSFPIPRSELMTQLDNVTHLAGLEIGGSNGMINLIAGSTKYLNLPIIDGDFMGRAYPTGWQTTPNVYDKGDRAEMLLPAAMCSGDGSTVVSLL
jgi:DUF917 family protein